MIEQIVTKTVVRQFKTSDGKLYNNRAEAKAHETDVETFQQIDELLKVALQSGRRDSIINMIMFENEPLRKILASYAKKQPKVKALVQ